MKRIKTVPPLQNHPATPPPMETFENLLFISIFIAGVSVSQRDLLEFKPTSPNSVCHLWLLSFVHKSSDYPFCSFFPANEVKGHVELQSNWEIYRFTPQMKKFSQFSISAIRFSFILIVKQQACWVGQ